MYMNLSSRCGNEADVEPFIDRPTQHARIIQAGLPTEATVAHVLVSKYADHLPLYRQAQSNRPIATAEILL
jgi:transposase